MARVQIPFAVETKETVSGHTVVVPVSGATVAVTNRDTKAAATVFGEETGGGTIASPVTDENGNIPGWLEEGSYSIKVSGGTPSISPKTVAWDAVRGDGVKNVAAEAVTTAAIKANAVTSEKIATGAIISEKLGAEAVTGAAIKKATITGDKLTSGSPEIQVLRNTSQAYTPSTTHPAFVTLNIQGAGSTAIIGTVKVNGVDIGKFGLAPISGGSNEIVLGAFYVPANQAWEVAEPFGIVAMASSYTIL